MTYSLVTADQSVRSISYDFSYHLYLPNRSFTNTEEPGDFSEAVLNIGLGPVSLTYKDNISGGTGWLCFHEDYAYLLSICFNW